jgi:hypothetical protein
MPAPFSGGCACGAIRYECSTEPMLMGNCHCRDCQRASGTGYSSAVLVPASTVNIVKGEPKYHSVTAASGRTARRGFCAECGSPLFADNTSGSGMMAIKPASLDDPSWFKPMADIWTSSAQPWDHMNPNLPKFPKDPMGG